MHIHLLFVVFSVPPCLPVYYNSYIFLNSEAPKLPSIKKTLCTDWIKYTQCTLKNFAEFIHAKTDTPITEILEDNYTKKPNFTSFETNYIIHKTNSIILHKLREIKITAKVQSSSLLTRVLKMILTLRKYISPSQFII